MEQIILGETEFMIQSPSPDWIIGNLPLCPPCLPAGRCVSVVNLDSKKPKKSFPFFVGVHDLRLPLCSNHPAGWHT